MELRKTVQTGERNLARTERKHIRLPATRHEGKVRHLQINNPDQMKDFALGVGIDSFCAQLGEGSSESQALQGFFRTLTATGISFNAPLYLRASSLPAYLILGMCESPAPMSLNGLPVKSRDYFLIMPDAHIDVFTRKPAKLWLVTIPVSKIETEAGDLYRALRQEMVNRQVYIGGSQTESRHLSHWFKTWEVVSARRNHFSGTAIMPRLSEIVFPALKTIALDLQSRSDEDITDSGWSDNGIKRLIDYFHDNPEDWISIEEACDLSDLGRRSLYYQFNKHTGLSPQKYFSRIRLSYLRQELVCGDHSITELALKYSFFHLGDFAATYKAVYGESPSKTRNKARKSKQKESRERHNWHVVNALASNG